VTEIVKKQIAFSYNLFKFFSNSKTFQLDLSMMFQIFFLHYRINISNTSGTLGICLIIPWIQLPGLNTHLVWKSPQAYKGKVEVPKKTNTHKHFHITAFIYW